MDIKKQKQTLLIVFIIFLLIVIFLYLIVRTLFFIMADDAWYNKLLALFLLVAESFGLIQSTGYFSSIMTALRKSEKNIVYQPLPPLTHYPPIAILVPSYKEPLHILKDTLMCCYNLTYPNKHLYLLDDTRYDRAWDTPEKIADYRQEVEKMCQWIGVNLFRRNWREAKAGIINDFLKFKGGGEVENLEFYPFQKRQALEPEKYLVIFDADMNPFPDFLENLVAYMEKEPNVAFIQTPQYYSNFEMNRVAQAAGLQQVIFYDYISEGKGLKKAMFCCGTNVVIRREALLSVGGFDEGSITEDFMTSLKMHLKGWDSLYFNRVSAFGMGPENLNSYFKQQFRWALGTLTVARQLPFLFFSNFKKMPLSKWWEYYLSATHYLVGWFLFVMFLFPILYLFNVPSYFLKPEIYITVFIPYFTLSIFMTVWTLQLRNYKPGYLLKSILLMVISFPVLIKAAVYAFFGVKGSFVVTAKSKGQALSLKELWPQLLIFLLCLSAITWGLERLYFERDPIFGLFGNIFWCVYNLLVLSSFIYFNNPENEPWLED